MIDTASSPSYTEKLISTAPPRAGIHVTQDGLRLLALSSEQSGVRCAEQYSGFDQVRAFTVWAATDESL